MNSKIVVVLSALTIGVGAVVFGYFTVQGMKIDKAKLAEKKIKLVSYPAFISTFGPGPELAKRFKQKTGIRVELVNGGDATLIVNRLMADQKLSADVVVGIDQMLANRALDLKWKPLKEELRQRVRPELLVFGDSPFIPIDWSPLTFIFKSKESPAKTKDYASIQALYKNSPEKKLVLEDPRASTLGKQWLYWYSSNNIEAGQMSSIPTKIVGSWSQAYGQFKKGSVDFVFSYLTSVIFHWGQEKDRQYSFYTFEEGHPFQVNAAGVLDRCRECEAAHQFIEFLLEPGSQALIMQKDYMLPAIKDMKPSGLFAELPQLKLISYDKVGAFEEQSEAKQELYLKSVE